MNCKNSITFLKSYRIIFPLTDGNLQIIWESGTKDYIFNGVMGYQRLSKSRNDSYTSGMKKLFD